MLDPEIQKLLALVPSGSEAAFPKEEFARRQAALRDRLKARGLDLFLTSGPENVFYLSGQQTPGYYTFQCLAIPASGEPFHVLRGLESMNARANSYLGDISGYADDADPAAALAEAVKAHGFSGRRIGIDRNAWFLTVNLHERLTRALGPLEDGSGLVEEIRRVKSPAELQQMAEASRANDAGMRAGLAAVRAGATENDVAAAILQASVAAGGEYVGMEPFVTSGPRSGVPHTTWRRRKIERGDVVILETSACWNRYHAALYRTVAVGAIPDKARDMYHVCQEGLAAATAVLKPGQTCADVHHAAQAVIDRHGYTAGYRKRTGYSIGISFAPDWGEGNILSLYRGVDVPLQPGMVFHVPITLREYAKWTVAVSETLVVTPDGGRRLSTLPADLVEA